MQWRSFSHSIDKSTFFCDALFKHKFKTTVFWENNTLKLDLMEKGLQNENNNFRSCILVKPFNNVCVLMVYCYCFWYIIYSRKLKIFKCKYNIIFMFIILIHLLSPFFSKIQINKGSSFLPLKSRILLVSNCFLLYNPHCFILYHIGFITVF